MGAEFLLSSYYCLRFQKEGEALYKQGCGEEVQQTDLVFSKEDICMHKHEIKNVGNQRIKKTVQQRRRRGGRCVAFSNCPPVGSWATFGHSPVPSSDFKVSKPSTPGQSDTTHGKIGICICFDVVVNIVGSGEPNRVTADIDRVLGLVDSDIIYVHVGRVYQVGTDRTETI